MIVLHTFGPNFGLPEASTFVHKADMLLKMSGVAYETTTKGFNKAPKGKLPYIEENGTVIADSAFIRLHLEQKHGIDFDPGLNETEKAIAHAFAKMCEEHLYWAIVDARWIDDDNFNAGPRVFFEQVPAILRPLVITKVRRDIKKSLWGQGLGRHTPEELNTLAAKDLKSLATFLADKPYFMGDQPTGVDASVFPFVAGALCPFFETPLRDAVKNHPNLVSYCERCMRKWYPEYATA